MAFNKINVGNSPNDGNGDTLRDAMIKVNSNLDNTYTKEEVDDLIEDVEVDLSNYDTKAEVNTKIATATNGLASETYVNNAIADINIPTKTSELENDGNGVANKPFLTVDDIPALSNTIDQVLKAGNTSNEEMILGKIKINVNTLLYPMQMLNSSNQPAHRWGDNGNYLASNAVRIAPTGEGIVELGKFSTGVLVVNNLSNNRTSKLFFDTVTNNAEIRFRNTSGTVALLSDVPSVAGLVPEAPIDGNIYGRSAGTWVPVSGGSVDPTNQNIARSGNGYKLVTVSTTNLTLGTDSLMFGTPSSITFASGANSVAFGTTNRPEGARSMNVGSNNYTMASATDSFAFGIQNTVSNINGFAIGQRLSTNSTVVSQGIVGKYSKVAGDNLSQQFIVAIGESTSDRQHGLEVLNQLGKGFVRAPFQKGTEMYASTDDKILVHKEYVEFYYTPRITFDNLEDRVTVLENASNTPAVGFVSGTSGIRRTDTIQSNYGGIGTYAVDFSIAPYPSSFPEDHLGATGQGSFAAGQQMRVNGSYSVGFGSDNKARRDFTFVAGTENSSNATASATFGFGNSSIGYGSLTIGRFSTGDGNAPGVINWNDGDEIFKIGNGTDASNKADAYVMYNDGTSTQNGIASYGADYSASYTDRSLVDKGYVLNPETFIELLTNSTPTQINEIKTLLGI